MGVVEWEGVVGGKDAEDREAAEDEKEGTKGLGRRRGSRSVSTK